MKQDAIKKILIIGAGPSGAATAIRLLRGATHPLKIILLEKRPIFRYGGIAYSADVNSWHYIFNIQAGRMSLFREDVDDFIRWANNEADRKNWHKDWREATFNETSPAPRRIFQQYIKDRLSSAVREAADGVELLQPTGEAIDIRQVGKNAIVAIEDYVEEGDAVQGRSIEKVVDHVVIASGIEMKLLPFAKNVLNDDRFIQNQYTPKGIDQLNTIGSNKPVIIVGSVLTAYDAAIQLLRNGHRGKITMASRSGITLRTYPENHQHAVIEVRRPPFLDRAYQGKQQLIADVLAEWDYINQKTEAERPDVHPAVRSERIIKAWEPYIPELFEKIPAADVRDLLARFGTLIATQRVSAMPYATQFIEAAINSGQIEIVRRSVEDITIEEEGLKVTLKGEQDEITMAAGLVVSNLAREVDYGRVKSKLWKNLIENRKVAVPHKITGRGIEVTVNGALLNEQGIASSLISVVGIPREGDEMVRNGRTGAFTINLATIKNHSVQVAGDILRKLSRQVQANQPVFNWRPGTELLPWLYETLVRAEPFSPNHQVESLCDRLTSLQIRLLCCTTKVERGSIKSALDQTSRQLEEVVATWIEAPAIVMPHINDYVQNAALNKLTDGSVTPRELREQLGF